jgi:hypothetical protein
MMWNSIDTAPKDGSSVLLLIDGKAIEGWWKNFELYSSRGEWEVVTLHSHGCGCCSEDNDLPTHWMPLPEMGIE